MNTVKRICGLLVGFVLFIAGLLKMMDPVGAGLQVEAYFRFLHLSALNPVSGAVAWLAALVETSLGAAVLTGIWRRQVRWIVLGVLACFTLLTAVIWLFNPDMECGCFGEAVHFTHAQSLIKNVVLLCLWSVEFCPSADNPTPRKTKFVGFALAVTSVTILSFLSLANIPPVDYTSLKPGTELAESGVSALSIVNSDGEYCDSLLLDGRVIVISVNNPFRMDQDDWKSIESYASMVRECGFTPVTAVAGASEEIPCNAFTADRRALLTLNRSNGGAVYIADSQVIQKWPSRSLPDRDDLISIAEDKPMDTLIEASAPGRIRMQGFLLYVFAVMLLL